MKDLFEREQRIYDAAARDLKTDAASTRDVYKAIVREYGRLLKQLRRVTKLSDKTTVNLNASKLDLNDKLIRMSSLAESSPNFISYKKFTGECVYLNPAASVLTGYSHDELMEDYISLLVDEETADYLRNEIPAALKKQGILTYEVSFTGKDGETRDFSVCSFLVDSDEEAFGTVATDITEKKRMEAEKLDALEKAEQASRAKSDFLSRVNHEMRTPMNAIIGMASIAQKTPDLSEMQEYLGKINAAAAQLLGIIDDVLDMSKIYAGEAELLEENFCVHELLEQVGAVAKIKLDENRQAFSIESDAAIPEIIIADKQKLARVLTNLLDNAGKFTPEGGNVSLSVRMTEDADNRCKLQFTIEDDGIGITEEQKARIWDAFEQSDNTITRQYGGTGLGLSIAQSFVNMMGSTITVESEPGKGAAFSFTIEVGIDRSGVNAYLAEDTLDDMFIGKHILLVDDVEINREVLIALLSDTGLAISCAENGVDACKMVAENPGAFDLILMDIHMPEMNGYEAAKAIRAMEADSARTIPIIAVTADVDHEKSDAAGMNDSIGKPLDIDIVLTKLKQYLFTQRRK